MTKDDLIALLAEQTHISKEETSQFLTALTATILEQLSRGEVIQLPELGSLELRRRKERPGHNPRTGEPITIPATTVVHFRPSSQFKRAVNP